MDVSMQLLREQTGLLVIDIQEKLAAVMPEARLERLKRNVQILLEGAKLLQLPIVVTEQYPKGIGSTVPQIQACLPPNQARLPKMDFSCWQDPATRTVIKESGRQQWILCGMETHVCVFQTARDMVSQAGYEVYVVEDAVVSRIESNLLTGMHLMERAGCVITSTEAVLFDLLQRAGTDEFKAISRLVR